MEQLMPFGEILEAVARLPHADQVELVSILRMRMISAKRERLVEEVDDARREFTEGKCVPRTPDELLSELLP